MTGASEELLEWLTTYAFSVDFNANDVWAWAFACECKVVIEDLPKVYDAYRRFGHEGVLAFMSLAESQRTGTEIHPQEPHWDLYSKNAYDEARVYISNNLMPDEESGSLSTTKN